MKSLTIQSRQTIEYYVLASIEREYHQSNHIHLFLAKMHEFIGDVTKKQIINALQRLKKSNLISYKTKRWEIIEA